ncbi:MAG TPA: hypothetical protein VHN19_15705 [Burkholderiales bacterium]|nr:hypothetical protein [Burkholderiales bacterium]
MVRAALLAVSIVGLFSSSALAGDIYRFRTADGRTILTDNPSGVDTSARLIETAKYDGAGRPVRAPELPDKARDRALEDVRYAESELLQAYNRLTAGVRAHPDELMPAMDEGVPPRKGKRKIPRTPEYYARIGALQADIDEAQKRLDAARERLYALN